MDWLVIGLIVESVGLVGLYVLIMHPAKKAEKKRDRELDAELKENRQKLGMA